MKNFFKKLSFVLASAMVITSLYAPANTSAAAKDGIILKGKAVTKKGIFVGGEKVNFDYKIGKHNNKGANGKWSVSDTSVITVDKHGKVTAVGTGDATLYLKVKKNAKKGIKKNLTFKVKLNAMARADKLTIPASDKAITLKVGEVKDIMPVLTDKVEGVKNTYNLFAKSSDDSVATAKAENGKVVVEAKMATSSAVTVTVFAAQKNSAEEAMNNKYKVEDSFTVTVMSPLEASQVKANKVLVKGADFSKVTTSGAFEVKDSKGNSLKLVETVVLNTEKTEATLQGTTSQIPEGAYTVKFNESTAEFNVEKAKPTAIVLNPEDKAVLSADRKEATVFYKVVDQFEEDVTNSYIASNFNITASNTISKQKKGEITFQAPNQATGYIPNVDKISLSIVDLNTGVNKQGTVTVDGESRVWAVEFKGVWNNATRKLVDAIPQSADFDSEKVLNDYRLLFTAKDQYGNDFYGATGNGASDPNDYTKADKQLSVGLLGVTGLIVDSSANGSSVEEIQDVKYLVYKVKIANDALRAGSVDVNTIIVNNGKTESGKFEVIPGRSVAKLTVTGSNLGVYEKKDNILEYTALDTDGKPVTDWKTLKNLNNTRNLTSYNVTDGKTKLYFEYNQKNGKVELHYYPVNVNGGSKQAITTVLSFLSQTNEFSSAMIPVNAERKPNTIVGIDKKVARGVTRLAGNTILIEPDALKFQDQYGNEMSASEIATYNTTNADAYKLRVWIGSDEVVDNFDFAAKSGAAVTAAQLKNETNAATYSKFAGAGNGAANTGVTLAASMVGQDDGQLVSLEVDTLTGTTSLDAKVNVALLEKQSDASYKEISKTNFKVYNAVLETMSGFALDDISLKPAKDLDYLATNTAVQNAALDNKFEPSAYGYYDGVKIALKKGKDFSIFGAADKMTVVTPDIKSIPEGKTENTATVVAHVHNSSATELKKEYTYSKKPRRVAKVEEKVSKIELTAATDADWNTLKSSFELKDQYGKVDTATVPTIIFDDFDNKKITVKMNGSIDASIAIAAATSGKNQDVVTVKMLFPGTTYVYEKVLKFVQQ